MKVTRPALRYFGGKWRLAPWIISHFPPHVTYVEPFCGAASVFLRKRPAQIEVINDLDGEVVNFFRMLRERTDELIFAIQATPYSRQEYKLSWQPVEDSLERARRCYIRMWQGWGGRNQTSCWRIQHSSNRGKSVVEEWSQVEHLFNIAERLKMAFIENDEGIEIIKRYDQLHTLFYLDPPYLPELRSERWTSSAYRCEVDEHYHRQLLELLLEPLQGMVVISGYPSDLYDERLIGWQRVETTARTTNTSNIVTEVIWLSPSVSENRLPLFRKDR